MYFLSRLLLALTTLTVIYCMIVVAIIVYPWSAIVPAIATIKLAQTRRRGARSEHGTARVADEDDVRRAGMLDAQEGLILGRLAVTGKRSLIEAVGSVFSKRIGAEDACRKFWARFSRKASSEEDVLVKLPQGVHTAIFAPTRSGKGVSCILPFLLTCDESCVVIDPKGENALLTSEARKNMGHEIVVLDPYKMVTQ
jgi:type IV secretion system protein VirD4